MPVEVEIGTPGRKVDSRGIAKEFTPEFFKEVAESYNPANFKAPAIISHDTKGIPDDTLHKNKELSYGAVSAVKMVGDRLKVVFDKLSPKIKEHFDNGELLSVSPSFYPPGHHANPSPGKWSLRHTAFLGSTPPAIKRLNPPEFAEIGYDPEKHTLDFSFPVELDESGETLEFNIASRSLKSILGSLRDWLVEKHGREEAEKIMPSFALDEIAMSDRYDAEANNRLWEEINDLKSQVAGRKSLFVGNQQDHVGSQVDVRGSPMASLMYGEISLGKRLAKLAKEKNITYAALAKAAGIAEGTVGQIINGEIENPPKKRIKGFAKALGVRVNVLMPTYTTDMNEKTMKTKKKKEFPEEDNGTSGEVGIDLDDVMDEDEDDGDEEEMPPKKKKKTVDMNEQQDNTVDFAAELLEERRARKMLELEVQNERRKAESERQRRKQDGITSFCENLVKDGHLTAAQMGDRLLEFGEGDEAQLDLPSFMMSLDDSQLSFMEDFLSEQPQQIMFGEFASDDGQNNQSEIANFNAAPGATFTEESKDEFAEVLQYCEANSLDPDNSDDFNKAALAALK